MENKSAIVPFFALISIKISFFFTWKRKKTILHPLKRSFLVLEFFFCFFFFVKDKESGKWSKIHVLQKIAENYRSVPKKIKFLHIHEA